MTTTTRPLPEHGTYARANGSPGYRPPCKCEACIHKRRAVRKRLNVNRQLGRPNLIDATPARQHLDLLRQDMSWPGIAEASGCNRDTLAAIHNGTKTRITSVTYRKILAVSPGAQPTGALCIDATGTRRRLQALQVTGRSLAILAAATNTTRWRLGLIANGQPTVTQSIADRVADVYRQMAHEPVLHDSGTARARNTATAKGWRDPAYWDDVDRIDDPTFDPDAKTPRLEQIAQDAWWLLRAGETRAQIAVRLGISRDYVEKALREIPEEQVAA